MRHAFWFTIASADLAALTGIVLLLRNTFAHQFAFGNKAIVIPKFAAVIVLWLIVAVPLTAGLLFARRVMRG